MLRAPVIVLNANTKREHGRKAQLGNIAAARAVADLIRTSLGPRAMLKMLLDPMGGIVVTNDGNAILREIDVTHPAAKSMLELARAQDENVGDGTTSVIILAGEMLNVAEPLLQQNFHPQVIVTSYFAALDDALTELKRISIPLNLDDPKEFLKIVNSSVGTKFSSRWENLVAGMAIDAVKKVTIVRQDGTKEIDIKRYARVEKIPGGEIEDSRVLDGLVMNKDIVHPQMRREIRNPRIILLDGGLEYKKGEAMTDVMLTKEEDFNAMLRIEEEAIQEMCNHILKFKPDLVIVEKGISDLAMHIFTRNNISAIRRVRKTDNNRIARACGANIVNRPEELSERDVGTGCGLFKIEKIGDEYFTFLTECKDPKACSIMLRGAGKEFLNEVERNLQDALSVARNVVLYPCMVPGGGASEMAVATALVNKAKTLSGAEALPYRAVASAFEVIPRTLAENCGSAVIRVITELRAKHMQGKHTFGVDGINGVVEDMNKTGIWEPYEVKAQTFKTAVESAALLLRIDDIVSGLSKAKAGGEGQAQPTAEQAEEAMGEQQ